MKRYKYKLKKRIYLILAIIILLLIVLSGIYWNFFIREIYDENNLPTRFVSYEFVSSRTEARLYYPGSQEYHRFGEDSARAGYAQAGAILFSKDPPEKIYAWYRQWFTTHGWHYDEYAFGGTATTQTSLEGYRRGEREKFYVAMNDKDSLGWVLGKKNSSDGTVFEIRYFINPQPTPTLTQKQNQSNY